MKNLGIQRLKRFFKKSQQMVILVFSPTIKSDL